MFIYTGNPKPARPIPDPDSDYDDVQIERATPEQFDAHVKFLKAAAKQIREEIKTVRRFQAGEIEIRHDDGTTTGPKTQLKAV
jgi:ribosome recycling factor